MATTTTVQLNPRTLEEGIYFNEDHTLRIECNWCSSDGYLFYDGDGGLDAVHTSKWLVKAAQHIAVKHQKEIKEMGT